MRPHSYLAHSYWAQPVRLRCSLTGCNHDNLKTPGAHADLYSVHLLPKLDNHSKEHVRARGLHSAHFVHPSGVHVQTFTHHLPEVRFTRDDACGQTLHEHPLVPRLPDLQLRQGRRLVGSGSKQVEHFVLLNDIKERRSHCERRFGARGGIRHNCTLCRTDTGSKPLEGPRQEAPAGVGLVTIAPPTGPEDSVPSATAGLAVGEDGHTDAPENIIDHVQHTIIEELLLAALLRVHRIQLDLPRAHRATVEHLVDPHRAAPFVQEDTRAVPWRLPVSEQRTAAHNCRDEVIR
mmetsp:Transcript_47390/g.152146  ORF Transcript_47390/g.152146 Transcript_47390/m.152146 type:complete len:291 (+) Transcript_47390:274-1146(+)